MEYVLEACVNSLESALAAWRGGADRLELCANLMIGGTTPSPYLVEDVVHAVDIPVNVLLRPRFGDFYYTQNEISQMCRAATHCAQVGANGIVIGALLPDGALNTQDMARMIEAAPGLYVTLHRAFDMCSDAHAALEQAAALGIDTILTSGQKNTAPEGEKLLAALVAQSAGRIAIMAGSGVTAKNIPVLAKRTGVGAFHLSGKVTLPSEMRYRREDISMGLPLASEYEIIRTDEENIRVAKQALLLLQKVQVQ